MEIHSTEIEPYYHFLLTVRRSLQSARQFTRAFQLRKPPSFEGGIATSVVALMVQPSRFTTLKSRSRITTLSTCE
jgi:hypothetical protein